MIDALRHWLFGCAGWSDHERDAKGVWWIGLRCTHCGKLKSRSRSRFQD